MTIAIANDHNGLELKQKLTEYLTNKGYNIPSVFIESIAFIAESSPSSISTLF